MKIKTWRYSKTKRLIFLVLGLLCWIHVNASTPYNATKSSDKIMYAIFKDRFTEPIEIMYLLMDDMQLYKITSNHENKVIFRMQGIKKDLKRDGHEISNIIVIIHNHIKQAYFSDKDINAYRAFKNEGFEGKFYIYVHRNRTIYELAERYR